MNLISKFAVLGVLFMCPLALADGVFMVVKGDVKIASQGKSPMPVKVGMKVSARDKIIAGATGRAKIVMSDKNILNISPNTSLVIESYKFNAAQDEKNVSLNVLYGKIRATVNQKYDGDKNKFQVKTPSAVAGVRGTDFLTSYDRSSNASRIVTFEGSVTVGSGLDSSGAIRDPVSVPAGTFSVASSEGPPSQAEKVPPAELQALNKETSTDGGRPQADRLPAAEDEKEKKEDEKEPAKGTESKKQDGNQSVNKPNLGPQPGMPTREPSSFSPTTPQPVSGPVEPLPVMPLPEVPLDLPDMKYGEDIYAPPEIPADLIQQNTNLTVNVSVQ